MQVLKSRKNFLFNRSRGKPYKDEVKTYSAFSRDSDPYHQLRFWPTLSNTPRASFVHVPVVGETDTEDEYFAYRWYHIRTPAPGVGIHERIGQSIFLRSIYLKGYFIIKPRLQRPVRVKLMMMECKNRYDFVSADIGYLNEFDNVPTLPTDDQLTDGVLGVESLNQFCAGAYYFGTLSSSTTDTCRIKKVFEATLYPQEFKASATRGQSFGVSSPVQGTSATTADLMSQNSTSYHKFSTVIKINRHYNMKDYGLYFMWMIDSCFNVNEETWNSSVSVPGPETAALYAYGLDNFATTRADKLGISLKFYSKAYFTDS